WNNPNFAFSIFASYCNDDSSVGSALSGEEKAEAKQREKKRQEQGGGGERAGGGLEAGDVYLQLKVGAADCTPISRGWFPKERNAVSVRKMELIGPLERRGRSVANKTTSERMKSKPRRWMTYGGE
ncbi:hypothetical protein K0M31_012499, partial [Melipona bicolor]